MVARRDAGIQFDDCFDVLSVFEIWQADYGDICDSRVLHERVLHFLWIYIDATRNDEIRSSVCQEEKSIGVEVPNVTKRAPSEFIKRRRGLDWILIVFELICPAEINQAVLPRRKFVAVFTHDMNLAEDGSTHCARMSGPGSGVDSYESVALGTGVVLVNDWA